MEKYFMYNDDQRAAEFCVDSGIVVSYKALNPELLPMQIRSVSASADTFMLWLEGRSIDLNTLIHRNMVNEMLGTRDKLTLALMTHMFGISDTFTCFHENEFTSRAELVYPSDQEIVSQYILVSSDTSLRGLRSVTPNVSTDGSFPKTWRYENGEWWLYKKQSSVASRCEVEISQVLKSCHWDTAEYRYDGSWRKRVKTKNFLRPHEFFEPYESFRFCFRDKRDEDEIIYRNLASLGTDFENAWIKILMADAFFENTDRHPRNFGVIRSSITGEILRLAPNFDNNQAYLANPGGKYSGQLLKDFMNGTGRPYASWLDILISKASEHDFLKQAVDIAGR